MVSRSQGVMFRIECKWQQATGSVDEKYPYVIENCKIMPESMIIILIDGGGYKEGALQWLKQAAEKCRLSGEKDTAFKMERLTSKKYVKKSNALIFYKNRTSYAETSKGKEFLDIMSYVDNPIDILEKSHALAELTRIMEEVSSH